LAEVSELAPLSHLTRVQHALVYQQPDFVSCNENPHRADRMMTLCCAQQLSTSKLIEISMFDHTNNFQYSYLHFIS